MTGVWRAIARPAGRRPFTTYSAAPNTPEPASVADTATALRGATAGLLAVGPLPAGTDRQMIASLAAALGWPVLADIQSGLRHPRPGLPEIAIARHHDLVLAHAGNPFPAPDVVLHLGGRLTSKAYLELLGAQRARRLRARRRTPPPHRPRARGHQPRAGGARPLLRGARSGDPRCRRAGRSRRDRGWSRPARAAARAVADVLDADPEAQRAGDRPRPDRVAAGRLGRVRGQQHAGPRPRHLRGDDGLAPRAAGRRGQPRRQRNRRRDRLRGRVRPPGLAGAGRCAARRPRGPPRPGLAGRVGPRARSRWCWCWSTTTAAAFSASYRRSPTRKTCSSAAFGTPHGYRFEHACRMFDLDYHRRPATRADARAALARCFAAGRTALVEVGTDRREEETSPCTGGPACRGGRRHRSGRADGRMSAATPTAVLLHGFLGSPDDWKPTRRPAWPAGCTAWRRRWSSIRRSTRWRRRSAGRVPGPGGVGRATRWAPGWRCTCCCATRTATGPACWPAAPPACLLRRGAPSGGARRRLPRRTHARARRRRGAARFPGRLVRPADLRPGALASVLPGHAGAPLCGSTPTRGRPR